MGKIITFFIDRSLMWSSLASFLILTSAPAAWSQQACTSEHISKIDDKLSNILILENNETPIDAIQRIYKCRPVTPRMYNVNVAGQDIGTVAGYARDNTNKTSSLVIAHGGIMGLWKQKSIVNMQAIAGIRENNIALMDGYKLREAQALSNNLEYIPVKRQGSIKKVSWVTDFLFGLWLPPARRLLTITSAPDEASISMDGKEIGKTVSRTLTKVSVLKTIILDKVGFKPCSFSQGSFKDDKVSKTAFFGCTLSRLARQ